MPDMAPTNQYQYQPLDPGQIRILHLLPGQDGDALVGQLNVAKLQDSPTFEALSYVWGSNDKILTLDISGLGQLKITASLDSALTRIRHADLPRMLWVDAVCINQDDLAEKEEQVPLMAAIYSSASRVVADLGPASEGSDAGLRLLERYWRKAICSGSDQVIYGRWLTPHEVALIMDLSPDSVDMSWADHELPDPDSDEWHAVAALVHRPWFTRLWIVQEFVLASDVVFYCGRTTVDWRTTFALCFDFGIDSPFTTISYRRDDEEGEGSGDEVPLQHDTRLEMYYLMCHHRALRLLRQTPQGRELVDSVSLSRYVEKMGRARLLDLLHAYRSFSCALDRDRYFALLGLASDLSISESLEQRRQHPALRADYTTDATTWSLNVSKFLLRLPGGCELFMRAGLSSQLDASRPSWTQTFGDERLQRHVIDQVDLDGASTAAGVESDFVLVDLPECPEAINLKGFNLGGERIRDWSRPPHRPKQPSEDIAEVVNLRLDEYICHAAETFMSTLALDPPALEPAGWDSNSALEAMAKALAVNSNPAVNSFVPGSSLELMVLGLREWLVDADRSPDHLERLGRLRAYFLGDGEGHDSRAATPSTGHSGPTAEQMFLFNTMMSTMMDISPATTSPRGRYAGVPRGTKVDDEIWVLAGCRLPALLRRSLAVSPGQHDGMYRLVGFCYLDGFMEGEALLEEGFTWQDVVIH